jgi:plasmid stabilization system protein ParE
VDYQVVLSEQALENLSEITAWIARDDGERAESFGHELLNRVAILATFPRIGSPLQSDNRWRKLVSPPYLIIYTIDEGRKRVEITTFRHASRLPFPPKLPD